MRLKMICGLLCWGGLLCLVGAAETEGEPPIRNTQPENDVTPAEVAAKTWKLPEGFQATVFAAEPMVRQPIHFSMDERGRVWVAENNTYAESAVNFARDLNDHIVILEDTDHDGKADKRTVFWDKAKLLTSVVVGFDGVWALCAPNLLFIPDRNHDDIPDGPPEVVLDGWDDGAVRHNIVNGLMWGPDGWLYGRHGILATSLVGAPGSAPSQRTPINTGIWRYHPTRKVFESVAHGTTNPWGMDYDAHGQMFFINTVIGHLWHAVPGAHYRRMFGVDFDPTYYEFMEQTADHFHWDTKETWSDIRKGMTDTTSQAGGGHAHSGLLIYQGQNWPAEYQGGMLTINLHGQRLNHDALERVGSGYVGRHRPDLAFSQDKWFRAVDLMTGRGGEVFIADWSDVGECHENDGVHRTSGRIYSLSHGQPQRKFDTAFPQDPPGLVKTLLEGTTWEARHARRRLQELAALAPEQRPADLEASARPLWAALRDPQVAPEIQLRALWGLNACQLLTTEHLLATLQNPSEHVRTWAVRLLSDGLEVPTAAVPALVQQARTDTSGLVRLFLASALQKLPAQQRLQLGAALASREEDATDDWQNLLVWYGLTTVIPDHPVAGVRILRSTKWPKLQEFLARRLSGELERSPVVGEQLVALISQNPSPETLQAVLTGMSAGLKGWRKAPMPTGWEAAVQKISVTEHPELKPLLDELAVVFGDGRALTELLVLAKNGAADSAQRQAALRILAENRNPELLPDLLAFLNDHVLRVEAIRGLAAYDQADIAARVLDHYARLSADGKGIALQTLTARPQNAQVLLQAMAAGRIPKTDLTAYHARQIQSFKSEELQNLLREVWGETRVSSADKIKLTKQLREQLTPEVVAQADLSAGRALFQKSCATCHVLFGTGGRRGPDLTGGNRRNLDYLLENIVDPSATLASSFRTSVVELKDGRVLNGVVQNVTEKTLNLLTVQEELTLARDDIEEITQQTTSLMPDGLLQMLTPDQIRDLLAYLSGPGQVALPAEELSK